MKCSDVKGIIYVTHTQKGKGLVFGVRCLEIQPGNPSMTCLRMMLYFHSLTNSDFTILARFYPPLFVCTAM